MAATNSRGQNAAGKIALLSISQAPHRAHLADDEVWPVGYLKEEGAWQVGFVVEAGAHPLDGR